MGSTQRVLCTLAAAQSPWGSTHLLPSVRPHVYYRERGAEGSSRAHAYKQGHTPHCEDRLHTCLSWKCLSWLFSQVHVQFHWVLETRTPCQLYQPRESRPFQSEEIEGTHRPLSLGLCEMHWRSPEGEFKTPLGCSRSPPSLSDLSYNFFFLSEEKKDKKNPFSGHCTPACAGCQERSSKWLLLQKKFLMDNFLQITYLLLAILESMCWSLRSLGTLNSKSLQRTLNCFFTGFGVHGGGIPECMCKHVCVGGIPECIYKHVCVKRGFQSACASMCVRGISECMCKHVGSEGILECMSKHCINPSISFPYSLHFWNTVSFCSPGYPQT